MKHLKNAIAGASQIFVLSPPDDYQRPTRSGFKKDASALRRDAGYVAKDLRNNTKKYVK